MARIATANQNGAQRINAFTSPLAGARSSESVEGVQIIIHVLESVSCERIRQSNQPETWQPVIERYAGSLRVIGKGELLTDLGTKGTVGPLQNVKGFSGIRQPFGTHLTQHAIRYLP